MGTYKEHLSMNRKSLFLLFLLILLCKTHTSFACSPYPSMNFTEIVGNSPLIVIGQRENISSRTRPTIEIKILSVLKGNPESDKIIIDNSAYYPIRGGECPRGISINDNKKYILFLENDGQNKYKPVEGVLSDGSLPIPIINGFFKYNGISLPVITLPLVIFIENTFAINIFIPLLILLCLVILSFFIVKGFIGKRLDKDIEKL